MSTTAPKRRRTAAVYKPGKFECASCRREIRGETHLRHKDRELLALCTDCYTIEEPRIAGGVLWAPDTVRLIDTSTTRMPLLAEDWAADQEVRLLEGILNFGFGNWRAVAEHLGFEKTEQECEDHYERFYLRSKKFPIPDLSQPPQPVAPQATVQAATTADGDEEGQPRSPIPDGSEVVAATTTTSVATLDSSAVSGASGATSGATSGGGVVVGGGGGGGRPKDKPKPERRGASGLIIDGSAPPAADLVGFMPLRGEYDTEWQNEAELRIAEIEFLATDSSEEHESKMRMLREYNRALDERQRRRDFVQAHDLIERAARQHAIDRRITHEERSFRTAMRPYAPYVSTDEHETLIADLLREATLRKRIEHLLECAAAGVVSSAEADSRWRRRLADEHQQRQQQQIGTGSRPPGGPGGLAAAAAGIGPAGVARPAAAATRKSNGGKGATPSAANGGTGSLAPVRDLPADELAACSWMGVTPSVYVACKRVVLAESARRTAAGSVASLPLARVQELLKKRLDKRRVRLFWQHCLRLGWLALPRTAA